MAFVSAIQHLHRCTGPRMVVQLGACRGVNGLFMVSRAVILGGKQFVEGINGARTEPDGDGRKNIVMMVMMMTWQLLRVASSSLPLIYST